MDLKRTRGLHHQALCYSPICDSTIKKSRSIMSGRPRVGFMRSEVSILNAPPQLEPRIGQHSEVGGYSGPGGGVIGRGSCDQGKIWSTPGSGGEAGFGGGV